MAHAELALIGDRFQDSHLFAFAACLALDAGGVATRTSRFVFADEMSSQINVAQGRIMIAVYAYHDGGRCAV